MADTLLTSLAKQRGTTLWLEVRGFSRCCSDEHSRHGHAPGPLTEIRLRLRDVRLTNENLVLVGEDDAGQTRAVPLVERTSIPDGWHYEIVTAIRGPMHYQPYVYYDEINGVLIVDHGAGRIYTSSRPSSTPELGNVSPGQD